MKIKSCAQPFIRAGGFLVALCFVLVLDPGGAQAFHWEVISVEGDLNVGESDPFGIHPDIPIVYGNNSLTYGSAVGVFNINIDEGTLLLDYNMRALPLYLAGMQAKFEMEIVADPEDDPGSEVYINFNSDANVAEESSYYYTQWLYVDDVLQVDIGDVAPTSQQGRFGPFVDGSRLRYGHIWNEYFDWAYAMAGPGELSYSLSLSLTHGGPSPVPSTHSVDFMLHDAAPNPFNPQTTIAFEIPSQQDVTLRVFDLSGRLVRSLKEGESRSPGRHEAVWNGRDDAGRQVASGTYFYRLEAGDFAATKRMVLVK